MPAKPCPNLEILQSLQSSLDRLQEASWFIRMMEEHYHKADQFRWSLCSFLRSLKEVLQLVTMEVQNNKDMVDWLRGERNRLSEDPVVSYLFNQRDVVVHRAMLKPASKGTVGFTRGRGLKLGLTWPIDPLDDSKVAILKYIHFAVKDEDFLGILYTDADGSDEYTCVQREWRLDQFPDEEVTSLAAKAWELVAQVTYEAATRLGAKVGEPKFMLGNPNQVQFEIYNPEWVKEQWEAAKRHLAESGET